MNAVKTAADMLTEMVRNIAYRDGVPLGEKRKPVWQLGDAPSEMVVFLNLEKAAPLLAQGLYDHNIHQNEPGKMSRIAEAARSGMPMEIPRDSVITNSGGEVMAGLSDGRHRMLFAIARGSKEIPILWTGGDQQPLIEAGYIRKPNPAEIDKLKDNSPGGAYHEQRVRRQVAKDCVREQLASGNLDGLKQLARTYGLMQDDERGSLVEAGVRMLQKLEGYDVKRR